MKKQKLLTTMLLLFALIVGSSSAWATDTYSKVTNVSQLVAGKDYLLVSQDGTKSLSSVTLGTGKNVNKDYYSVTTVTASGDKSKITDPQSAHVITLGGEEDAWTFYDTTDSKYVSLVIDGNYVNQRETVDDEKQKTWTISIDANGLATITSNYKTARMLQYNASSPRFACYKNTQANGVLYVKDAAVPVDLTSFDFSAGPHAVQLEKSGLKWAAEYTQTVVADPDDYDGAITYTIVTASSTIPTGWTVNVSSDGEVSIDATTNEAATIVVKATGEATAKYNAPDDATYTLSVSAAPDGVGTPTFSKATGSYYYNTKVEIASINSTAIYYTTNGDTPSKSSTLYDDEEGVKITSDMTLKAIGYDGETASEVASIDYTLKAPEAPTFSIESGAVAKGTTVTLTPGEGGSTIIYTTDGTTPSYSGSVGEIYSAPIVINYAQTIKAISVDDAENESSVASATYTLTIPAGSIYYKEMTNVSELTDGGKILIVSNDDDYAMSTTQASSNRPAVSIEASDGKITSVPETAQVIELEKDDDYWYFKVGNDAYLYASSGSSNQLKTSTKKNVGTNGQATISISAGTTSVVFNRTGRNTMQYNYNNGSPIFNCYADASQTDVKIYVQKTDAPTETVTVTSHGWATYVPSYAVQFPANRAYVVTDVDGDKTEVETVTRVPARTPVLLKGEGEVTATILDEDVDAPSTNLLSVGTGYAVDGKYSYVLAKNGENKAGFKQWTGDMSVLKDRVVLLLDNVLEARDFLFLDFEGETTALSEVRGLKSEVRGEYFNLNGQRVAQPTKGLYIVNGKKVVIK